MDSSQKPGRVDDSVALCRPWGVRKMGELSRDRSAKREDVWPLAAGEVMDRCAIIYMRSLYLRGDDDEIEREHSGLQRKQPLTRSAREQGGCRTG